MTNGLEQPSAQMRAAMTSLQLRAWSAALTIRIARISGDRETSWQTASGVLIEFEKRALIATAWHVLEQFKALRDSGEMVALVCDNLPIMRPRTVYRDPTSDIAFIEVPQDHRGLGAIPYRPGSAWPPTRVVPEDAVLICGFPRGFRDDSGPEILHGDLNLLLSVTSVADKHFSMQVDWESMVHEGRVRIDPAHTKYGGASGGPAFLWNGGSNPLVGLIIEVGDTLPIWRIAALSSVPPDLAMFPSEAV